MLVTLQTRLRDASRRQESDERGATLVVVMIVMMVLMVGAVVIAAMVTNTASSLVSSRSTVQSRAAADAGLAAAVAQASGGDPCAAVPAGTSPTYSVDVKCDVPSAGNVTYRSTGSAGSSSTTVEAVYKVPPADAPKGLTGALVAGNGGLSSSTVRIDAEGAAGDVIVENGDLNCNSATTIDGSVIVRNGSASITNYCKITGSLYASKNLNLDSNASIGGDVVTLGTLTTSNSTYIAGSASARGNVILNNSTHVMGNVTTQSGITVYAARVEGNVKAGGALAFNASVVVGDVSSSYTAGTHGTVFNAQFGSIHVAAPFSSFKGSTVSGVFSSSFTGIQKFSGSTAGSLDLAGTYENADKPGTAGGVTAGSIKTHDTTLTTPATPQVPAPAPLLPDSFSWYDMGFDKSKWQALGYNVVDWTGGCDMATDPSDLKNAVVGYTKPTVVNALACGTVKGYGVTLSLRTDIVMIAPAFSTQALKVNSATGAELGFSLIAPDNVADHAPTCAKKQGDLNIYQVQLGTKITGLAYSPCQITIGEGAWNGQIYGGKISAGGSTWAHTYRPVSIPGVDGSGGSSGGGAGSGTPTLGALVSQRDVP